MSKQREMGRRVRENRAATLARDRVATETEKVATEHARERGAGASDRPTCPNSGVKLEI
jgi:hypothetical protein